MTAAPAARAAARAVRSTARGAALVLSATATGALTGAALQSLTGNRNASWIIGRAAGVSAYLLLVALVLAGLLLSHPWRTRVRRPGTAARIRVHVQLAALTLVLTAVHVVVLATDRWAGVGWPGALLPMGSSYRPAAVTLGLVGAWLGLLVGLSAAAAGRLPLRLWWPVHKVASAALVLIWAHGTLAGGDTAALRWLYVATGALVAVVAISRYGARRPRETLPGGGAR